MTNPTIHQVYVKVQDQPQADRLKAVCIEYGLPIPCYDIDFYFKFLNNCVLAYSTEFKEFFIYKKQGLKYNKTESTQVTEPQFIALCEEWVKENNK